MRLNYSFMKRILILICFGITGNSKGQSNPKTQMTTRPPAAVQTNIMVSRPDTTPIMKTKRFNKYINKPTSRYATVVTKIYEPPQRSRTPHRVSPNLAASSSDSTYLANAISNVLMTIRYNYSRDIESYVDTTKELFNIKLLRWRNNQVYRTDILGLADNIVLLNDIFRKPEFDEEDIEMIDYVFTTNDSLISKIQFYNYHTIMRTNSGPVSLTILDHNNQPIPYATCYFVDRYTWRTISNSKKCPPDPSLLNCDPGIISELESKTSNSKLLYNTSTQSNSRSLSYGIYHLIILKDNIISFHQLIPFDFQAGLSRTINLINGK